MKNKLFYVSAVIAGVIACYALNAVANMMPKQGNDCLVVDTIIVGKDPDKPRIIIGSLGTKGFGISITSPEQEGTSRRPGAEGTAIFIALAKEGPLLMLDNKAKDGSKIYIAIDNKRAEIRVQKNTGEILWRSE